MRISRLAALLLLLLCITQCLLAESREGQQKRRRKGKGQQPQAQRGEPQDGGKKGSQPPSPAAEGKKQRRARGSAPNQGRFRSREQAECKWVLRGSEGSDMNLRVQCKKGPSDYWCEFTGKPSACAKYSHIAKTYWKQVIRPLKKQTALCSQPSVVLKSSLCRSTKAAHLKMTSSSLLTLADQGKEQEKTLSSDPTANPDIDKIASEYCNDNWSSVCKFLFSAIQG
ncbi:fibroblast growth factor-binding protein 1-like [Hemiscyllium ocellatum]|uniref:fibroblast growth factor-binding protein 1-like n=1 Tax=Hemiscyllium ocellatum TaxID=170820 RepID=UPI0029667125|nr:fibroblast growth factor-binding protein 1-like [Hemiscyllium ocellatum]